MMKALWHAIAQCYVKEPLLYLFSLSNVKKGGIVSIKLKCDDELSGVASLWCPTPLNYQFSQFKATPIKKISQDLYILFPRPVFIFRKEFIQGALKVTAPPLSLKSQIQRSISAE